MSRNETIKVEPLLARLTENLRGFLIENHRIDAPVIIGIRTGGAWVAEKLHAALNPGTAPGSLNINFYRDDFSRIGLHPRVGPSDIRTPVNDRHVVLVDDVLHTGRTIRAALNEIFDYGRPASVTLAILVDRKGRELPIRADARGEMMDLEDGRNVKLHGPEPLRLEITRAPPPEKAGDSQ